MEEGFVLGLLSFFAIFMIIAVLISILAIVGQWKCFTKAGKPGWAAIIPFYNQWVNCEIVGINPWWVVVILVGSVVSGVIPVIGSLLYLALSVYFLIILYVSTARSFGKDDSFAIGLYFLGPIFWFLLGRDNVTYVGPTPMKDYVMELVNGTRKTNTTTTTTVNSSMSENSTESSSVRYCTGCGYRIENDEKFCPSCGREL